ncbi:ATP-grasp domain-containing protein [Pareuzebyella sediminis]|uniref:ATP-grasp domain-containing protein n=1 Tax=Pareuzebyella sediminis TaxID=2607998 RepID=UPI001E5F02C6|nr:ATP-grasp domain-containing protein [Pareuzebyella sediminis]
MTVLFTCAGRRNYLINYFKEVIGHSGKVIAIDSHYAASTFADADIAIQVPPLRAEGYISVVKKIIEQHKVDLVIPLNDLELYIISKHREELNALGARVIISNAEVVDRCGDKWLTYKFLSSQGISTPKTYLKLDALLKALAANEVAYPIILKPRWGSGSIGIEEATNEKELYLLYELLKLKINKSILKDLAHTPNEEFIILQEKISGEEYGVDVINDFEGNYFGAFARKKIAMRSGETEKAISVIDERIDKVSQRVSKAMGHVGIMDCDYFIMGEKIYVLEMNPRFGGGYPFTHEAGLNLPAIYLAWFNGDDDLSKYNNYRPDVTSSKCDRILRMKKPTLVYKEERPELETRRYFRSVSDTDK